MGKMKKALTIAWVAAVIIGLSYYGYQYFGRTLKWPEKGLATLIPVPQSNKGKIEADYDTWFNAAVNQVSQDDYDAYIELCINSGFDQDVSQSSYSFDAYHVDRYELSIYYDEDEKTMNISVSPLTKIDTVAWPTTGMYTMIPSLVTDQGYIETDSSDYFTAYAGEFTKESFQSYANTCREAGFTEDYYSNDTYFSGTNSDGYDLFMSYQGLGTVYINITKD